MSELNFVHSDLAKTAIQKTLEVKTLREAIYLFLRDAIIKQSIQPNENLQESDIAKALNVSTTPVREAILKLHAEGYIHLTAHRSARVKSISYSELIEIYQVLSVLDSYAAGLALRKATPSFVKELQAFTRKMEDFYKKEMIQEYLNVNGSIHSLIWEICDNQCLRNTIIMIQNQMLRYQKERFSFYSKPAVLQKSMTWHKRILKAFMTSDSDNIEKIVRNHWNISGIIE